MKPVFLDTDVFIRHIRSPAPNSLLRKLLRSDRELYCSVVAYFEVFVGISRVDDPETLALFSSVHLVDLDVDIIRLAAPLGYGMRKDRIQIPPPDLFIAATCIYFDAELATFDAKHMPRVPGLQLYSHT